MTKSHNLSQLGEARRPNGSIVHIMRVQIQHMGTVPIYDHKLTCG